MIFGLEIIVPLINWLWDELFLQYIDHQIIYDRSKNPDSVNTGELQCPSDAHVGPLSFSIHRGHTAGPPPAPGNARFMELL